MGGTKKKTLASMEKSQDDSATTAAGGEEKGKKKSDKPKGPPGSGKRVEVVVPRMGDQELMKALAPLKAITVYGAARSLSVNAAVARSVLASLETKGLVKRAGGFSGHYIWTAAS